MNRIASRILVPIFIAAAGLGAAAAPGQATTPAPGIGVNTAEPVSLTTSLNAGGVIFATIEDLRRTNDLPLGEGTLSFGSPRRLIQLDMSRATESAWRGSGNIKAVEAHFDGLWLVPVLVNGAPAEMATAEGDGQFVAVGSIDESVRRAVINSSGESYIVAASFAGTFLVDEGGLFHAVDAASHASLAKYGPRTLRTNGGFSASDFRKLTADAEADVLANQPPSNAEDPVIAGPGYELRQSGPRWWPRAPLLGTAGAILVLTGLVGLLAVRRRRRV